MKNRIRQRVESLVLRRISSIPGLLNRYYKRREIDIDNWVKPRVVNLFNIRISGIAADSKTSFFLLFIF